MRIGPSLSVIGRIESSPERAMGEIPQRRSAPKGSGSLSCLRVERECKVRSMIIRRRVRGMLMFLRAFSGVGVSACKRFDRGIFFGSSIRSSGRRSNFASGVTSSVRSSTTLHFKMNAAKATWTPTFVPVTDAGSTSINPRCLLRIVSYNVLAQIVCSSKFARNNGSKCCRGSCMKAYVKSANYPHSPRSCLRWKYRSEAVVSRLLSLDADLLCLQELDEYNTFYRDILHKAGYGSVYVQRGNGKKDGCGIFFKRTKISLLSEEIIDYNVLVPPPPLGGEPVTEEKRVQIDNGDSDCDDETARRIGDLNDVRVRLKRDCVGIIAAFKPLEAPDHVLVLACTHIFWDPVLMDVKLAQVHHLASCLVNFRAKAAQEYGVDPLLVFTGDFNSLPGDPVYNYLVSGTDSCKQMKVPENIISVLVDKVEKMSVEPEGAKESHVKEWVVEVDRTSKFPLPVVSLYAYADEEPAFTNYTYNFAGTLDYIFFIASERLKPRTLLALPAPGAVEVMGGLPNQFHPSDHLPIGCEFGLY